MKGVPIYVALWGLQNSVDRRRYLAFSVWDDDNDPVYFLSFEMMDNDWMIDEVNA